TSSDLFFSNSNLFFRYGSTTALTLGNLAGNGTKCLQSDNNGLISLSNNICGGGAVPYDDTFIRSQLFGKSWDLNQQGYLVPTTTLTTLLNGGFVATASSTVVGNLTITGGCFGCTQAGTVSG